MVASEPRDAWSAVFLGRCLLLPSMDALVALGAASGFAIDAAGSFPSDLALVEERTPAFVVIGDLHRVGLARGDERPVQYIEEVRALIQELRARTAAPILVHNLVVPTVEPAGISAGAAGIVQRVREIDVQLGALPDELDDVYVVDIDRALSLAGKRGLVDDMVVSSHHLGSLTWLVERSTREPIPTSLPATSLLSEAFGPRDALETEYVIAEETLRVMRSLRGIDRCKVVVVDLDDTLWPGILAETGAPFPPRIPVDVHPHHLYLGLHEALLQLRDRGILLACVSKNDEDVVRELWRYPPQLQGVAKLELDDFVTHRINWRDKVDNIVDIANELGADLGTLVVIDDSPIERERVRARLPEVHVAGENPFATRWFLLTDPMFQVPRVTDEARRRSTMVKGQLAREHARRTIDDDAAFLASLGLACVVRRARAVEVLARVDELVARTTQLNTTGDGRRIAEREGVTVYTVEARDRFVDYGLVGACIVRHGPTCSIIEQVVTSCRVIGLGVDQALVRAVTELLLATTSSVEAVYVATRRNTPARRVFADAGFTAASEDRWVRSHDSPALPPLAGVAITLALE